MTGHFKIITDNYEYESHNKILNSSKTIMALVLSNKFKISHLSSCFLAFALIFCKVKDKINLLTSRY